MTGRPCTVCIHPQLRAIEASIIGGMNASKCANQFGLNRLAVGRHIANHMGRTGSVPAAPVNTPAVAPDASPREKLNAIIKVMEEQVANGVAKVDTLRELRLAYNDLEKLAGGAPPTEVAMTEVEGLISFLQEAFVALEPFPEARRALLPVAKKHGLV